MIKSKISVASGAVFASLLLVLGIIGWLQGVSPYRVAQADGLIDDSLADFAFGSGCYVQSSGGLDGELIMTPTVDTDFPGSDLPAGWFSTTLAATVNGGQLVVDQGVAGTSAAFPRGQTLEFSATFSGPHAQFAGFSNNVNFTNDYAIFGTINGGNGHLYARANGTPDIDLGVGLSGTLHRFKIEWGASSITYTIYTDTLGTSAAYVQAVALSAPMSVMAFDDVSGASLTLDWLRLWSWTCTFASRVINSSHSGFTYTGISTTLNTPAGTSVGFEVRTSEDGVGWSSWLPVNASGVFSSSVGQYLQYSATLSSADVLITPEVFSIQAHGYTPNAVRLTSFSATESDFAVRALLMAVSGCVLIVGSTHVILRRRKTTG